VFRRNEFGRNIVLGAAKPWSDPDPITGLQDGFCASILGDFVFINVYENRTVELSRRASGRLQRIVLRLKYPFYRSGLT
jgi:hypothetical protein